VDVRHEDALLVMAWLASHPRSDSNTLGRIVTNGGTPKQVSSAGHHVASDLCRFGYVEATREKNRMLYTLTPKGRRLLEAP
jgi:predicted transcriptional regulator